MRSNWNAVKYKKLQMKRFLQIYLRKKQNETKVFFKKKILNRN